MDNKIILNRIQTPDGTILTSYHRHDYRTHCDEITGETYMVDGGTGYLHRSVNNIPATDLTIHDDEPFEVLRHFAHWGTRGKDGKQPLRWNPLKSLDIDHMEAILETQKNMQPHLRNLIEMELAFRK